MTIIGHRFSEDSQRVRDLLAHNQVPYRWLEIETDEAARVLEAASITDPKLPVVLFPDGEPLVGPDPATVAERVGLQTRADLAFYDLVVVGGGPAGLAAAVYGASEGLRTIVVERESAGGQAGQSSRIENYLGFPAGLSGADLAHRATTQARRFGAELLTAQGAVGLDWSGTTRIVRLSDGSDVASHTVLLATGVSYRRLEAKGADRLTGRGIWYGTASTGDAALLDGKEAFVVGGANSAGQAALHLSQATKVTILYRGDSLAKSMSQYLVERIEESSDITVRLNANVVEAHGEESLEEITIDEAGVQSRDSRNGASSSSSAPSRTRSGSETRSRARSAGSSSRARRCSTCRRAARAGRSTAIRSRSRRTCPASSQPATSATSRSSAWPRRSARARWPCS